MESTSPRISEKFAVALGLVGLLAAYSPLLWSLVAYPEYVGPEDWAWCAGMLEAFRKITQDFGQFPWWNPYAGGGFPYFGDSLNLSPLSVAAVLSWLIGAPSALKATLLLSALFAYFGMYRLAARVTPEPLFRALAAVLFCCNGGIVLHLSVGHLFTDYFYYPWIIESLLVVNEAPRSRRALGFGVLGGVFLGLACNSIIHYGLIYMLLTVAGLFVHGFFKGGRSSLKSLLLSYAIFAFSFLAIGGFRLVMCLVVNRDYPRVEHWELSIGALNLVRSWVMPFQSPKDPGLAWLGWWEWGAYVGLISLLLFLLSALLRCRAYHWIFLAGAAMYLYTQRPMPYYWLSTYVPVFQSMRVPARIRIWIVPYFAMGVVSGLTLLAKRGQKLAAGVAILALCDVSLNAFYAFHCAFEDKATAAKTETIAPNTKVYPLSYRNHERDLSQYLAVRHGYTHVPGYEPAIAELLWRLRPNQRHIRGVNEPDYVGEFVTSTGPVEPSLWTPNRIVFEGIRGPLRLNINPGSYWSVNGQEMFSTYRVADIFKPFIAQPDPEGRVVVEIKPKGAELALWVTVLSWLFAASLVALGSRSIPVQRTCFATS